MPKPTKIVVHFDDGTTTDIPAEGVGSIFMNEGKAKKCGHNPPYGKPPKKDKDASTSTATTTEDTTAATTMAADNCYLVTGLIICP